MTNSRVRELNLSHFSVFPKLHTLNTSGCSTQRITGVVSHSLGEVRVLDMRGCPVTDFRAGVFRRLDKLQTLYASGYRLCCPDQLPQGFNLHDCLAPPEVVSDCNRLLQSEMHVIFTAIAAAVAVLGNVAGCVARLFESRTWDASFRVLMLHLGVSDGLMGVYLAVISVADQVFRGRYQWQDTAWRRSEACHLSAFLSVLSSQVSAGIVCLGMLDGVATRCVRMTRMRFQPRSLYLSSIATWLFGLMVATVITFHTMSEKSEASSHALCTPMLVFDNPGSSPVFSAYIIFNCVLHVLASAGEVFLTCQNFFNSEALDPVSAIKRSAGDAKRLAQTYIVTSKVLCWFIVSLPATAHMGSVSLPEEVPVNIAVFVLPLSATLNPLLSVLAVVLTRRRLAQKARLMKILAARVAAKSS